MNTNIMTFEEWLKDNKSQRINNKDWESYLAKEHTDEVKVCSYPEDRTYDPNKLITMMEKLINHIKENNSVRATIIEYDSHLLFLAYDKTPEQSHNEYKKQWLMHRYNNYVHDHYKNLAYDHMNDVYEHMDKINIL